jgi:hypothetical protein
MKRNVLMVVLLVAGALALVSLVLELMVLPSSIAFGLMPASGSGGIGSVSVDFSGTFVEAALMLIPSLLLWRVCASLAAGGDRDMARHRRFHGIALIAVPLGILAMTIVSAVIGGSMGFTWLLLNLVFLGLTVMQLFSFVAAFKILMRGSQQAS